VFIFTCDNSLQSIKVFWVIVINWTDQKWNVVAINYIVNLIVINDYFRDWTWKSAMNHGFGGWVSSFIIVCYGNAWGEDISLPVCVKSRESSVCRLRTLCSEFSLCSRYIAFLLAARSNLVSLEQCFPTRVRGLKWVCGRLWMSLQALWANKFDLMPSDNNNFITFIQPTFYFVQRWNATNQRVKH